MSEDATLDEFVDPESETSETDENKLARKTVCGIPPQDWPVARLGEVVRVVSGNSLPTEYQNGAEGEHPVYKVSDMNASGNQKYVSDTANRLPKSQLDEINHTLYPKGTTILPKVGAALLTNKRRMLTEPSSFDNNVMGWVPDEINPEFLYYVSCMIDMEAVAQKGAVPSISKDIAKSLKIPSPPHPEQHKIASVLYTVDQAIEKTEEIIDHTKRLREALLNELLVSGYGKNRTTQEGYIGPRKVEYPRDWVSVELGNLTDKITKGKTPTSYGYDYTDSGINFVKVESISGHGSIDSSEFDFIGQDAHDHLSGSALEEGDILFSIAGALGKVTQIDKELLPANTNQALALIRVDDSRAIPEYIRYYLETTFIQKYIQSIATTTAQSNLNLKQVSEFKILLPKVNEQEKILQVIHTIEDKLRCEESQKDQYQRLKQGLMNDLLSGTFRSTDTNIEVPDEIAQHG